MKAEDLIKILKRERSATICIDGKEIEGFDITFSCTSRGEWVINFIPKREKNS